MSNPFWFNLIHQWKVMGKGDYGVTFPFLIGAVSMHFGTIPDNKLISQIFIEMKNQPVDGFYCEVRWCGNIREPVVSISPVESAVNVSLKSRFEVKNQIAIGFTEDLMNTFHLDCKTFDETFEKLILYTHEIIKDNKFSKNGGKFTPFSQSDIEFIREVQRVTIT